jgi:hypothetical protein
VPLPRDWAQRPARLARVSRWARHQDATPQIDDDLAADANRCPRCVACVVFLGEAYESLRRSNDWGHLASVAPLLAEGLLAQGQEDEAETLLELTFELDHRRRH